MRHLRNRLGGFVTKLKFAGGQETRLAGRISQRAKSQKQQQKRPAYLSATTLISPSSDWKAPAYVLYFTFKMPQAGIKLYTARISLDAHGDVLKEINLPAFGLNSHQPTFVSLAKIICIAASHGFKPQDANPAFHKHPDLIYLKKEGAIGWRFSMPLPSPKSFMQQKILVLNANTGVVIREGDASFSF